MNRTSSKFLPIRQALTATILAGAGLALFGAPIAQASEQITVTAPHVVQKVIGYSSSLDAPIDRVSLTRDVRYGDLDLSKPANASALKIRVADAARDACQELFRLYPLHSKDTDCVANASAGGMEQADTAIADASK